MPAPPIDPVEPDAPTLPENADWLRDERLQRLMQVVAGEDEVIRIVGGAVRNALMGFPVADVDLATTALPAVVTARTKTAGMQPVPTGIDHGTITVVVAGKPYEVTTLREDVATDGRRAKVKFGRDWTADAARRDFTVNALYADASGTIVDLVGGIADCRAHRIRFIGDPETRIREDYLRILRLFRLHASYGDGPIDAEGLAAAVHLRDGILRLSAERIGQEMLKLVVAKNAPAGLRTMQATGILTLTLATSAIDLDRFERLHEIVATLRTTAANVVANPAAILLASLAVDGASGCEHLAKRLRLSNAMRDRMSATWSALPLMHSDLSDRDARGLIFRLGKRPYQDAILLHSSAKDQHGSTERIAQCLRLGEAFSPPKPPISGHDLLALGVAGETIGTTLRALTEAWIASDFKLSKSDLLAHVQRPID